MSPDLPDLSQYTESTQYYSNAYTEALRCSDNVGRLDAMWGLIAKGVEAIPYALNLLSREEIETRTDGAIVLGWVSRTDATRDEAAAAISEAIKCELVSMHQHEALDTMVQTLHQLGSNIAIPILGQLINDRDDDSVTIWMAIGALSDIIGKPLLEEDDPATAARQWLIEHDYNA